MTSERSEFEATASPSVDFAYTGFIDERRMALGPTISVAALVSEETRTFSEVVPRSLTLVYLSAGSMNAISPAPFAEAGNGIYHAAVMALSEPELVQTAMMADDRVEVITMNVQPDAIADPEIADRLHAMTMASHFGRVPIEPRLRGLARELLSPVCEPIVRNLLSESFALEMLARAIQASGLRVPDNTRMLTRKDRCQIMRVEDAILANPGGPHTLASLAREAGLSASALKAKFPLLSGMPVGAFIRQARLELAYERIQREGMSISGAAISVGYSNPDNFSTAFRRQFGFAPSALRN